MFENPRRKNQARRIVTFLKVVRLRFCTAPPSASEEGAASPREEDTTRAMSDSMSAEATLAPSGVEMNRRMDICFSLKKEKI